MRPELFRKSILTLVWVIPTVGLAAFVTDKITRELHPSPPPKPELVNVPIEVIQPDQSAKVVYIRLETESVPEPSTLLLLPISLMALLRRRR